MRAAPWIPVLTLVLAAGCGPGGPAVEAPPAEEAAVADANPSESPAPPAESSAQNPEPDLETPPGLEPPPSGPTEVSARHILVAYKGANRAAPEVTRTKEEAKAKAEEILAKIKKGEGTVASLAPENSDCPSKTQGGMLGSFNRQQMAKPFSDAAFALQSGEVSAVVETDFGYHVIQRSQRAATAYIVVLWKAEGAPPEVARTKEEAKARIEEAAKKIKDGADFHALVKEYSDDPGNRDTGGYLPVFEEGQAPPEFDKVAFSLKVGEVSGVGEFPIGFFLMKRVEDVTYGARHILVQWKGSQNAPPSVTRTKEEAKQKAEEALGLLKGGAKMEDLARTQSDCPSRAQGGDLGDFGRGTMTPAFQKAVDAIKVGELSGVVETEFGYHVIQRTK